MPTQFSEPDATAEPGGPLENAFIHLTGKELRD
jgi:hypothetical protein